MSAATASPRLGYVGMEVTKRPPFIVLAVDDLMDEDYVLQGQPGYANEIVKPGDKLLSVDGAGVESTTVKHLHQLLGGSMHSLVELVFSRTKSGEEYAIKVRRHGLHQHDRQPGSPRTKAPPPRTPPPPPASSGGANKAPADAEIARLQARVHELEKEKADMEKLMGQTVLEARTAKQEFMDTRKQIEELKSDSGKEQSNKDAMPGASYFVSESTILDELETKSKGVADMLQRSRVLLRANHLRMTDMSKVEDQLRGDLAKSQKENEDLKLQCSNLERDLEVRCKFCCNLIALLKSDF
jgi:hypothetical protein